MTIRKKLLLGFVLMAFIGMVLGAVGLASSIMLTNLLNDLHGLQKESAGVSQVLNAHYIWRHGLTEFVLAETPFSGSLDPNTCALGKWLDSDEAKGVTDPEVLASLGSLDAPHRFIHTEAREITELMESGDTEGAAQLLTNTILPKTQEVITMLSGMEQRYGSLIDEKSDSAENLGLLMNNIIIALIVAALIACVLLVLLTTKSIVKPLKPLVAFMTKAGTTGDIELTQADIDIIGSLSTVKDEIGQTIASCASFVKHVTDISDELRVMADNDISIQIEVLSDKDVLGQSLQKMAGNLNNMFKNISGSTHQVADGSKQIADGSQSLAQGSTQQAAAV